MGSNSTALDRAAHPGGRSILKACGFGEDGRLKRMPIVCRNRRANNPENEIPAEPAFRLARLATSGDK